MPIREYRRALGATAAISVRIDTERGELTGYAVVLVHYEGDQPHTVRVWDNHQGVPHMHRYNRAGEKQPVEKVAAASTQEGLDLALRAATIGHEEIIRGWLRS